MQELRASQEGSLEVDVRILTEVLGPERPGRVRGYGMGPTPTQVFGGKSYRQSQAQNQYTPSPHIEQQLRVMQATMQMMARALTAMGAPIDLQDMQMNTTQVVCFF